MPPRRDLRVHYRGRTSRLVASPASGPPGTQIRLSGTVANLDATDRSLLTSGLIGLVRDVPGCEIVAGAGHPRLHLTSAGRTSMSAPLIVPRQGSCNHSHKHHAVTPGRYTIVAGCFTCDVAYFQVTNDPSAPLAETGPPIGELAAVGLIAVAGGAWLSRRYPRAT